MHKNLGTFILESIFNLIFLVLGGLMLVHRLLVLIEIRGLVDHSVNLSLQADATD